MKSDVTLTDLGYKCYIDGACGRGYVKDKSFIFFDKCFKRVLPFVPKDEEGHDLKAYAMTIEIVTAINNEFDNLGWREQKYKA